MDLKEIRWEVADWIHLAQDRGEVAGSCEHGDQPTGSDTQKYLKTPHRTPFLEFVEENEIKKNK
jgi:hypothetical protein